MEKLTESREDYLELIYNLSENGREVKAIDLVKTFNISRATVSETLNKLKENGLIYYESHKGIILTDSGIEKAKSVIKKHKVLTSFFKNILNLDEISSSENACRIEHVISEDLFERIEKFQKFCIKEDDFVKTFRDYLRDGNNG